MDCPAFRHVNMYSCCPDSPWVDMQYHLIFQRRSTLYNYILILPCILLTSITLILFFIPPESPAKMQLGKPLNIIKYRLVSPNVIIHLHKCLLRLFRLVFTQNGIIMILPRKHFCSEFSLNENLKYFSIRYVSVWSTVTSSF